MKSGKAEPALYAHSNPDHPNDVSQWEPLCGPRGHLHRVVRICLPFARRAFEQGDLKPLVALSCAVARWHDLGKFSAEFQNYLMSKAGDAHEGETQGRVDHSSAGAQYAMKELEPPWNAMVAYAIAGHHGGLRDGQRRLKARLCKDVPDWRRGSVPEALLDSPPAPDIKPLSGNRSDSAFQLGFATRMLFSCLVDADFLATESFMNPKRAAWRPSGQADFAALDTHLTNYMNARFSGTTGKVGEARADVLDACRGKAERAPGFYDLTVPTGGGKTLSSLAFALRHCSVNGLDRVIYAIPFTSIIEQTAEVFRDVYKGYRVDLDQLILEHHSSFDPEKETSRSRLASENWDSPLVVTTNVQLFESLFANKPSRCRKLHRIAHSVIILDEAQTLPISLLKPCLRTLRMLVEQYGCTVVLCTATQPAVEYRKNEFEIGLPAPTPIIDDAPALYRRLKRVDVCDAGTLSLGALADRMALSEHTLAIVNTRGHAARLHEALKKRCDREGEGCYHLSAAMTPEHRSLKLDEIHQNLQNGQVCRVVSTQLIEAGVDIDFPVVWRALAGLDSIAQAAGRCNREGKYEKGTTWLFQPEEDEFTRLSGNLKSGANAASEVIGCGQYDDLLGLDAIEQFFRLHYWSRKSDWDKLRIFDAFDLSEDPRQLPLNGDFETVGKVFRFIKKAQRPVVVGWDQSSRALIEDLRQKHNLGFYPDRKLVRRLQRQTVTVSQWLWKCALEERQIELFCDERFSVLADADLYYSSELGLQLRADPFYDPTTLIID